MSAVWYARWISALGACIAAAVFFGAPARAQTGLPGEALSVCVLRDAPGLDPATLIHHPERFDCTTRQDEFGAGTFWAISQPVHAISTPEQPLRVRVGSVWQQGLALYIHYADGHIAGTYANGRATSRLIQLGAIIEQSVPPRAAPVTRLLWRVDGSANLRGILLGARLATRDQSDQSNLTMAAIYSAFAGLAIALLIYNLALWAALRHGFQLAYCAMVAGLLVYAASSSGVLAWIWTDIQNNDRLRLNYLMLGFAAAAALVFARTFFEPRIFEGWLGRLTTVVACALFGSGLFYCVAGPYVTRLADTIFAYAFLAMGAVVGPMLWRAWRRRSNYLWLFGLAWSAPILTAFLRAGASLHLLPWNFWLDNSTILAMATEALLSSVAIAYRIRILSQERDVARENETIARRLADIDPLTGLLNRRSFLEKAIGRGGEQILLITDIDHFKQVNDTLGHDGGDEVLRVFARMLRSCVPASALVARLGGEEFAIITNRSEPVEAEAILSKLRTMRMPFDLTVTASIGGCTGPLASETDWKLLYRGADAALFEAKSSGRDRARSTSVRAHAA